MSVRHRNDSRRTGGGLSLYSTESEHYDLAIREMADGGKAVVLKMNIGGIRHDQAIVPIEGDTAELVIRADSLHYDFCLRTADGEQHLGSAQSKWLSNEVSSPFTGVVLGLYAQGRGSTRFDDLLITYTY
ncbi:MAG: hypothetical protein IJE07_07565 [Clostridia bacterium]|nr:hypothetical protein [Clostridia bacterium]